MRAPTPNDPPTFSRLIRERLRALLARTGMSLRVLEHQMGRGNGWLSRKLKGDKRLYLVDLDEMLEHLGEPPEALLRPATDTDTDTDTNTNEDDNGERQPTTATTD